MAEIAEDRQFVQRICGDDAAAIEELLFKLCGPSLRRLSAMYNYPDLLGELYLHLKEDEWRRLRTWQGRAPLRGWMKQVAVHLCIKKLKEEQRFTPLENEGEERDARLSVKIDSDVNLRHMELMRAIFALADGRERLLMTEHILLDRDIEQVSRGMKISRANADVIKHRATKHLRELLKEKEGSHVR